MVGLRSLASWAHPKLLPSMTMMVLTGKDALWIALSTNLCSNWRPMIPRFVVRRPKHSRRWAPPLKQAAPALVQACAEDDESLREWVVSALEQLGAPADTDLPALVKLLDADELSAYWAATLLGRLHERAAPAVAPLTKCVAASPHPSVRQRAIWALGQIGSAARSAAEVLQQAAASSDPRTARLAREAIDGVQQS